MKKAILLLIFILLLNLFSCSVEPYSATGVIGYSENFPQEFCDRIFANYPYCDENLYYFSASPWEAEFKVANRNLRIAPSLIEGVDKSDFIAATEIRQYFIGPPEFNNCIYQSEDAPLPMRDWTVKDIALYISNWLYDPPGKSEEADLAQNVMKYHMTTLKEIEVFDRENAPDFIDGIKASYAEPVEGLFGVYPISEEFFNSELNSMDSNGFYLLVRFEENENLVWLASVMEKDGMLYLECTVRSTSEDYIEDHSYLPLGEEYSQIIADLIGYELEKPATTENVTSEGGNTETNE